VVFNRRVIANLALNEKKAMLSFHYKA